MRAPLRFTPSIAILSLLTATPHPPRDGPHASGVPIGIPSGPRVLRPGSPELIVDHLVDDSRVMRVLTGGPFRDARECETARLTRTERNVAGTPGLLSISLRYAPPVEIEDSLVVLTAGLVPRDERFRSGRTTMEFRFDGEHVRGVITDGATTRAYDRRFREPVFPLNALGTIVRSLPFAEGYEAVIPLFSAQDTGVLYDTLSVVGAVEYGSAGSSARAWHVRAAGPTFVTHYVVDSASRRIVAQELVVRASDTRVRLTPASVGAEAPSESGNSLSPGDRC
jgi:hypothetical protein